jgi:hypothetical protein
MAEPEHGDAAITLAGIDVGRRGRKVLDNLDLTVERGTVTAISIGGEQVKEALKQALAMGADVRRNLLLPHLARVSTFGVADRRRERREAEAWGRLVDTHLKDGTWVVQDMVEIPRELYPNLVGDEVRMDLMNVNINPFVFGGRYAGAYTRISKHNVINVSYGGGLAPTITATPTGEGPA